MGTLADASRKRARTTTTSSRRKRKRSPSQSKNESNKPDESRDRILRLLVGKDDAGREDDKAASPSAHSGAVSDGTTAHNTIEPIKAAYHATATPTSASEDDLTARTAEQEGSAQKAEQKGSAQKAEQSEVAPSGQDAADLVPPWVHPLPAATTKRVKVIVLLENATLESVTTRGRGSGATLLNCDDHRPLLLKSKRDANSARPDITHQCLLALLDSPLNKMGHLKIFVHTQKNVLIDVASETRIPRTYKRFAGVITEVLEKFKVRGTGGDGPLLRVVRNPITSHLPVGTRKFVCTYNTENVVDIRQHSFDAVTAVQGEAGKDDDLTVLYVIGAMAHGKVTEDWADEEVCISELPLSAATVCSRLTYAFETMLGIS